MYVIIAELNWRERKRRVNVLSLALDPHNSDFSDVIKVIEPGITRLNKGTFNEIEHIICVFTMTFTGNIK